MKPPNKRQAESRIAELLSELIDAPTESVQFEEPEDHLGHDHSVSIGGHRFLVEYKSAASAGRLAAAIENLKANLKSARRRYVPLLVVPFMGMAGRELCQKSEVSWIDLSGNASITGRGLRIDIQGRPNRYVDRGRPPNLFAPKSSRISRQLLMRPSQWQSQSELARRTLLDEGYVSRVVRRLKAEQFLEANDQGAIRPRDPDLLLDAWQEAYEFGRNSISKGHITARTGIELLQKVAEQFSHNRVEFAATALSAAWLYTNFAMFRLVTIYLKQMPSRSILENLAYSDEPRGANIWLVLPNDEGVFQGGQKIDGIQCVSPLQTFLDLKGQPERAKDSAVQLRKKLLNWKVSET